MDRRRPPAAGAGWNRRWFPSSPRSAPLSRPYALVPFLVPTLSVGTGLLAAPRPLPLRGRTDADVRNLPRVANPREVGLGRGSVRIIAPTRSVGASMICPSLVPTSAPSSRPCALVPFLVPTLSVGTGLLAAPRPLHLRGRLDAGFTNLPRVANPREVGKPPSARPSSWRQRGSEPPAIVALSRESATIRFPISPISASSPFPRAAQRPCQRVPWSPSRERVSPSSRPAP